MGFLSGQHLNLLRHGTVCMKASVTANLSVQPQQLYLSQLSHLHTLFLHPSTSFHNSATPLPSYPTFLSSSATLNSLLPQPSSFSQLSPSFSSILTSAPLNQSVFTTTTPPHPIPPFFSRSLLHFQLSFLNQYYTQSPVPQSLRFCATLSYPSFLLTVCTDSTLLQP